MTWLADMYVTLLPGIVAGVLNMVWCLLPVARPLSRPIDGGRAWRDGRRWLGDNKTWKGLVGMTVLGLAATVAWAAICARMPSLEAHMLLFRHHPNTWPYAALLGAALGLTYALFELPNSFLKRRFDVTPGRAATGGRRVAFTVLDQIDSIIGMVLVVALVCPMTIGFFLLYVLVGGITHAAINLALFAVRLRKNPL